MHFILLFFFLLLTSFQIANAFDKVVIWGHKLHSHTHSYIHQGFFKAFKVKGYDVYWMDDKEDVSSFDFSSTLFLTEGQADKKIPLMEDCKYLVHNPSSDKYKPLDVIYFQVYTDDILSRPNLVKVEECIYYDLPNRCLYMPWATDLFPDEIDEMKKAVPLNRSDLTIYWIGTIGKGKAGNVTALAPYVMSCIENGFQFICPNPWGTGVDIKKHIKLIQSSYMAPAIVGDWQMQKGYVPCRIFKNISYGQMGITNSKRVYELFEQKIVYNPDTAQLFYDALERIKGLTCEEQWELMDMVKCRHTYLNRTQTLLDFLDLALNNRQLWQK